MVTPVQSRRPRWSGTPAFETLAITQSTAVPKAAAMPQRRPPAHAASATGTKYRPPKLSSVGVLVSRYPSDSTRAALMASAVATGSPGAGVPGSGSTGIPEMLSCVTRGQDYGIVPARSDQQLNLHKSHRSIRAGDERPFAARGTAHASHRLRAAEAAL